MNLTGLGWAVIVLVTGQPAAIENPLLDELLRQGVLMSDGSRIKLPPPTLRDGLDAAGQRAVLDRLLAATKHNYEDLVRRDYQAPVVLDIRAVRTSRDESPARRIDLWFVAHGDFKTATSEQFLESLWRSAAKPDPKDPLAARSVTLTPADLAKRQIRLDPPPGVDERYVFGTVNLFDRVLVSATQRGMLARRPQAVVVAEKIDARFTKDAEYPNQWQSVTIGGDGKVGLGEPQPYSAAGSYGRATPLASPPSALLFEFHLVYEEPKGWFGGANLMGSKLPLAVQDQVRNFRRRLAKASGG